jgi:uncharacterized membrane protein
MGGTDAVFGWFGTYVGKGRRCPMDSFFAWELVYPIATLALLIAMVYGAVQYRKRNRANDRRADEVVRDRYEHPEKWNK